MTDIWLVIGMKYVDDDIVYDNLYACSDQEQANRMVCQFKCEAFDSGQENGGYISDAGDYHQYYTKRVTWLG